MSITDQIQTVARREYALLRAGAKALDARLEPAVSGSPGLTTALSRVREVLRDLDERVTGAVPDVADEQEASSPVQSPASSPTTSTTTPPASATKPTPKPKPKADGPKAAESETAEPEEAEPEEAEPEEAEPEAVEHLAEELLEEEDDHHAGELADNEDLRDVQARLRAKHAVQEFKEQQT